jgi:hypothetical protein
LNKSFLLSPEAAASTEVKSGMCCRKKSGAAHHFRFRVPLQADCCYFYGMAEGRFF